MGREIKQIATRDFFDQQPIPLLADLTTEYNESIQFGLPNLLSLLNTEIVAIRNGVSYIENEMLMDFQNFPRDIFFELNENDELIGYGDDIEFYTTNSDNELVYDNPNV